MDKASIIKEAVAKLMTMFKSGEFSAQLATTIIRKSEADEIPSDSWSIGNRILMTAQNTGDARGYNQWQEVGRQVKKGSKAIYIFAPLTKKITETDAETGEETKKVIVYGFRYLPVFRYEDTEGEPLPDYDYTPKTYPPFFDVAEKLGVSVEYRPMRGNFLGRYSAGTTSIQLCSQDAHVYYHELAHAIHNTFVDLKTYDYDKAEIVAEFTACVLCELTNISGYESQGYEYIKRYCGGEEKPEGVLKKIMGVLNDVEKIVFTVISTEENKA